MPKMRGRGRWRDVERREGGSEGERGREDRMRKASRYIQYTGVGPRVHLSPGFTPPLHKGPRDKVK